MARELTPRNCSLSLDVSSCLRYTNYNLISTSKSIAFIPHHLLPAVGDEEYFCLLSLCVKSSGQLFYHGVKAGGGEICNVYNVYNCNVIIVCLGHT